MLFLGFPCREHNCTYIMYHGTSRENAESIKKNGFRRSEDGMFGPGVYVSRDLRKASRYPLDLELHERVVLKLKVQVGKVIKINRQNHPMKKTWHNYGYDTAWCPPNCGMVKSGLEEDCVWDPKNITVLEEHPADLTDAYNRYLRNKPELHNCTYIMYHGTSRENAESIKKNGFRRSEDGMFGPGVYVSRDLRKASRYPLDLELHERVVLKLKVQVGKVIKIDHQNHPMKKKWHDYGYDTAWCPANCLMVMSGLEEVLNINKTRHKCNTIINKNIILTILIKVALFSIVHH
uniref:PARP catalytic domain-containing protein n=1 Tax=Denticeps clupeoides TaxID=299321 RepID=A0AAY4A8I4_9TELE